MKRSVRNHNVAAGRHSVAQRADHAIRYLVVRYIGQGGSEHDCHRPAQVQQILDLIVAQNLCRLAKIALNVGHIKMFLQDGPSVCDRDRVYVYIHNTSGGVSRLHQFVNVAEGGQTGTNVKELVYALLDQEADVATHTFAPAARLLSNFRNDLEHFLGHNAVGLEIVMPTQQIVVYPSRIGSVQRYFII